MGSEHYLLLQGWRDRPDVRQGHLDPSSADPAEAVLEVILAKRDTSVHFGAAQCKIRALAPQRRHVTTAVLTRPLATLTGSIDIIETINLPAGC